MLNSMICRIYGEEKSTHFQMEWIHMAYTVVKIGKNFNWKEILTFNICQNIWNILDMKKPSFYMSAYLGDAILSSIEFPTFGWIWDQDKLSIHAYCSYLWDINYNKYIYDICDCFLAPLHIIRSGYAPHRISREAIAYMKTIIDWYLGKNYTYIRIYVNSKAPHLLPKYVFDIVDSINFLSNHGDGDNLLSFG
jgi:hypothetical protein